MPSTAKTLSPIDEIQDLIETYALLIHTVDQAHRAILDLIEVELEKRMKVDDISAPEALLLYRLGSREIPIGELAAKASHISGRLSQKVQRLVDVGWLSKRPDPNDRRSQLVRLTDRGLIFTQSLRTVFQSHAEEFHQRVPHGGSDPAEMQLSLDALTRFWRDMSRPPCFRDAKPPKLVI